MEEEKTYTVKVLRYSELLKEWNNQKSDFEAFRFLLNYQSSSVYWACKHEGYSIVLEEEKHEQSKS